MIRLSSKANTISVETGCGILTWDALRGGQISGLLLKDDLFSHSLIPERTMTDLRFSVDGNCISLSQAHAEMAITRQGPDFARIMTRASLLQGALSITQEYEVHEEGALFCNLAIDTAGSRALDFRDCSFDIAIDTRTSDKVRWGYYLRRPVTKRDFSTMHVLTSFSMFRERTETADERELFPLLSLELGWPATRYFSNHLEFLLEDWTSFGDAPLDNTHTRAGQEDSLWQIHWHFLEGRTIRVHAPYRYRNRWGMMFGRARTQSGHDADPSVRNNALGRKICHCMYPYVRAGDTWPWVSMPIKQVDVQAPQTFKGNPEVSRVDEAAGLGADTMIIHQFWMSHPGSNNEPSADYHPFDPEWLHAFTNRCHELRMRVAFYVRSTEMWLAYSSFFEDFLQKDWDGMYSDWNTPFSIGFIKCSTLHVSMHNYFHFTKALRRRVGDDGLLLGHSNAKNLLTSACFDAILGGEVSVRHDELLTDPESSAYYAQLNCSGAHLISGHLPDREAFSGPKATAICAALGMTSHPIMEPDIPFIERTAFIKPLWDAMSALPGKVVRLHNPAYAPTRAVKTEAKHLFPSLWQADSGKALLLVTNMADVPQTGTVELNIRELDVPRKAKVQVVPIARAFGEPVVDGSTVCLNNIPPLTFSALLIG